MDLVRVSLIIGWTSMVPGALSGAWIGLFFADDRWRGGYPSFDRRLLRLGHIAFFGLGFVNVLFALSESAVPLAPFPRFGAAIGGSCARSSTSTSGQRG